MTNDKRMPFLGVPKSYATIPGGIANLTKATKVRAKIKFENAGGSTFPASQLFNGQMDVKLRGNTTAGLPKKPHNISLLGTDGKKTAVTLFGMPAEADWCVLTEYQDKTHLRTLLGNGLSYCLGLPWAARGVKFELYVRENEEQNYEYYGLCTLTEKVEQGTDRINIAKMSKTDIAGEAITGGYMSEQQGVTQLDRDANGNIAESYFIASDGTYHSFKAPAGDGDIVPQQVAYFQTVYEDFLHRVNNVALSDAVNGWRGIADAKSYARYFLLQDLSKNQDAFVSSWYTTKNRGVKLEAGPGWDWNGGFGPTVRGSDAPQSVDFSNPNDTYIPIRVPYYTTLMDDPFFADLVAEAFVESLPDIHQLLTDFDSFVSEPEWLAAVERDRVRWPDMLTDPLFIPLPDYSSEVARVSAWCRDRLYHQTRRLYDIIPPKAVN